MHVAYSVAGCHAMRVLLRGCRRVGDRPETHYQKSRGSAFKNVTCRVIKNSVIGKQLSDVSGTYRGQRRTTAASLPVLRHDAHPFTHPTVIQVQLVHCRVKRKQPTRVSVTVYMFAIRPKACTLEVEPRTLCAVVTTPSPTPVLSPYVTLPSNASKKDRDAFSRIPTRAQSDSLSYSGRMPPNPPPIDPPPAGGPKPVAID